MDPKITEQRTREMWDRIANDDSGDVFADFGNALLDLNRRLKAVENATLPQPVLNEAGEPQ